jgi:hypothetical protein
MARVGVLVDAETSRCYYEGGSVYLVKFLECFGFNAASHGKLTYIGMHLHQFREMLTTFAVAPNLSILIPSFLSLRRMLSTAVCV